MSDLFAWTSLSPARTGLPVTICIGVHGVVATNPCRPDDIAHHDAVFAWVALNRPVLTDHWRGAIDGGEMATRSRPLS